MCAQLAILAAIGAAAGLRELAGELALRIVRARHERAVPPAAQRKPTSLALGTLARVRPVLARGEQVIGKELVQRLGHFAGLALHHLVGLGLEVLPEGLQHSLPRRPPAGHVIQLVLHSGGEVIGDIAFEEPFQKRGQQTAGFLGEEPVLLGPHIVAVLQYLQRGRVGRRAANAQFFQPLDQAGFGIARRRLGEMLRSIDALLRRSIARTERGQHCAILVIPIARLVAALLVNREETGELHDLPGGAQLMLAGAVAQRNASALDIGGGHLAGHRPLVDQVIKPRLVAAAVLVLGKVGRADRLVGFLRVLRLGFVVARLFGQVVPAVAVRDRLARIGNRAGVHLHPVGPHVGDRTRLIQGLGHPHGVAGGKAQLPRRFLLQRGGGERRIGIAPGRLRLDLLDPEGRRFHQGLGAQRDAFLAKAQLVELLALEAHQPCGKFRPALLQPGNDRPVFLRAECLNLALALDDQTQRDRLHPARALGAGQLAPQHRGQREAEQVVQRAAGKVGVDQVLIQFARAGHRLGHGLLGDRVEGDALDVLGQRLALGEQLAHVPRNRLALAVRVSREDQAVSGLGGIGDRLHLPLLVAVEFPVHREGLVRADRAVLGRQVADMAIAGENLVVLAEILLDGLGLGGGFYDDKLHGGKANSSRVYVRARVGGFCPQRQEGLTGVFRHASQNPSPSATSMPANTATGATTAPCANSTSAGRPNTSFSATAGSISAR